MAGTLLIHGIRLGSMARAIRGKTGSCNFDGGFSHRHRHDRHGAGQEQPGQKRQTQQ